MGAGTASEGLVLAQSATQNVTAHELITFNLGIAAKSVTFTIYDLTRVGNVTRFSTVSQYIDAVSFSTPATVTAIGDTGLTNARLVTTQNPTSAALSQTTTTGSLTNYFYRTSDFPSSTGNRNVSVSLTLNGATSFQMAYDGIGTYVPSATGIGNSQWIVIGDMTICT